MNKRLLGLIALPLVIAPLAACNGHTGGTGKAATKAKATASVEDQQLTQDGYTPFHAPGFGKADVGIKGHSYEGVVYAGKLSQQVVYDASQKPQNGVVVKAGNSGLVVIDAVSLGALKNGFKAVGKSL